MGITDNVPILGWVFYHYGTPTGHILGVMTKTSLECSLLVITCSAVAYAKSMEKAKIRPPVKFEPLKFSS